MTDPQPESEHLDSALLALSRRPRALLALLRATLPESALESLARDAGTYRKGADVAAALVEPIVQRRKHRRRIVEDLLAALPVDAAPDSAQLASPLARFFRREALLAGLRRFLCAGDLESWERAGELLESWSEWFAPAPEAAPPARPAGVAREEEPPPAPAANKEAEALAARLQEARKETERLADELGRERKRREAIQEQLAESRDAAEEERRRATAAKRKFQQATEASLRERVLEEELEKVRHAREVLAQKFQILEEEREDLHAVLEDHDRFQALPPEEVPSFRARPLQPEERELAETLAARRGSDGTAFRVLVVGGGEPQLRHREKLVEYAQVLGFHSDWRMAEYTSWHKEMERLEIDMARRFDALVILHWNRTTFTRKAREICNRLGQKPCLTCHYEGFTSLRRCLQAVLRQLLGVRPPYSGRGGRDLQL
ncbi:MAG: hypothetical protein EYC70_11435 [Planctomycetota bacterium]|nr:MAG: hypothetical protein EYC70_11435 [Planctomycetota bacterium]